MTTVFTTTINHNKYYNTTYLYSKYCSSIIIVEVLYCTNIFILCCSHSRLAHIIIRNQVLFEDEGDKTATKFCTICGCGEDPVPASSPSPPADNCKDNDDKIELTEEGKQKCKKTNKNGWCDKKVNDEGDKTAAKFCTICGCVQ